MWAETGLRWLDRAAGVLAALGGLTVVFLVGLIVVKVFWRYVIGDPIFGVDDITKMALAVVVAGSVAYGARHGAHVHVDVLNTIGGRPLTRYTDVVVRLGGSIAVAVTAFALWEEGACGFRCGDFTDNLNIVHTPFYNLLALAMAIYAAILMLELVVGLAHLAAERDPNEHA